MIGTQPSEPIVFQLENREPVVIDEIGRAISRLFAPEEQDVYSPDLFVIPLR